LPEPTRVSIEQIVEGNEDSQYVAVEGTIRAADFKSSLSPSRLILRLANPNNGLDLWVLNFDQRDGQDLVGATVVAKGVCLLFANDLRQAYGHRLVLSEMAALTVVEPAAKLTDLPERDLGELLQFSAQGVDYRRVRVRGIATYYRPGKELFIQSDWNAGLLVLTRDASAVVKPGEEVEVIGFPAMGNLKARLEDAIFRVVGSQKPSDPKRTKYEYLQHFHFDLVEVIATVLSQVEREEAIVFNLEVDGKPLQAFLRREFLENGTGPELLPQSLVRIAGVCVQLTDEREGLQGILPKSFSLLLRSPEDIVVTRRGPWFTGRRLMGMVAVLCGILGLSLIWGLVLRRKVEKRTKELAREIQARHNAALEFDAVLRERTRLAADLHDTLEQSLAGVGLQLQVAARSLQEAPERAPGFLSAGRQMLDLSRAEVRRSVWSLRSPHLEQGDLAGAIAAVVHSIWTEFGPQVEVRTEGEVRALPEAVANQLLRIAQEMITNALKHSGAERVEVTLAFSTAAVTLRIQDTGSGCDPGCLPGPEEGHYGLQSTRERVKRIGGKMQMQSAPGKGMLVEVSVPLGELSLLATR
jgi:signal transduction histidine kinase